MWWSGYGGFEGIEEVRMRILGVGDGEGRGGGIGMGGVDGGRDRVKVKREGEDGVRVVEVDVFGENGGVVRGNG